MQLDLILRGQSNAALLVEADGWAGAGILTAEVERLLGFDGVTDRVRLVHDRDGQGGETNYPGTAFLGEWMVRDGAGWAPGPLERGFLDSLGAYRGGGMGDATAILWMHSEYDSRDAGLQAADWAAAVRADAALVRGLLGREVPYLFVAAHPYGDGTDAGHQAIRLGMESLAADAAFDARIAARAPDLDIAADDRDFDWRTTDYGGAHMTAADAALVALRLARGVAQEYAGLARPGSPVALAGGEVASDGPRVVAASQAGGTVLAVDVRHDGVAGFAPLSAGAASGLGWTAELPGGARLGATGAALLDADTLLVSFAAPVPDGALLHYAWGIGRVAAPGGPGQGNAVLDAAALPVWTPAAGVMVGAPAGGMAVGTPAGGMAVGAPASGLEMGAPAGGMEMGAPAGGMAVGAPAGGMEMGAPAGATPAPPPAAPTPAGPTGPDPELALAAALLRLAYGQDGSWQEGLALQARLEEGAWVTTLARELAEDWFFQARLSGVESSTAIAKLYLDGLDRLPEAGAVPYWEGELAAGLTLAELAAQMAGWSDFRDLALARAADGYDLI